MDSSSLSSSTLVAHKPARNHHRKAMKPTAVHSDIYRQTAYQTQWHRLTIRTAKPSARECYATKESLLRADAHRLMLVGRLQLPAFRNRQPLRRCRDANTNGLLPGVLGVTALWLGRREKVRCCGTATVAAGGTPTVREHVCVRWFLHANVALGKR